MSLQDKVGQMFMVGTSVEGANPTTLAAVRDDHVGGIFLHGRSDAGTQATADLIGQFTSTVGAALRSCGSPPTRRAAPSRC